MNSTNSQDFYLSQHMEHIEYITEVLSTSAEKNFSAVYLSVYDTESVRENAMIEIEQSLTCLGCNVINLNSDKISEFDVSKMNTEAKSVLIIYGSATNQIDAYCLLGCNKDALTGKRIAVLFLISPEIISKFKALAPYILEIHDPIFNLTESDSFEEKIQFIIETAWAESDSLETNGTIALEEGLLEDNGELISVSNSETSEKWINSMMTLGIINWRRGNFEKADKYLRKAIKSARLVGDNLVLAELHNALALVETHQEKFDLAITSYKNAISFAPSHISAWNNLGYLCLRTERYDEALYAFQKAIEQNDNNPLTWNGLGKVYFHLGYLDDAISAFEKSIQLGPLLTDPWVSLGDAQIELGNYKDANFSYKKALELNNKEANTWIKHAEVYARQNKTDVAINIYEQALALGVEDYKIWNELGLARLKIKDFNNAKNAFIKSIELNPDFGRGYNNLATAYTGLGKLEQAGEASKKCLSLTNNDEDNATAYETLANIYRLSNNYEMSLKCLQLADHLKSFSAYDPSVDTADANQISTSNLKNESANSSSTPKTNFQELSTSGFYEYPLMQTQSVTYLNPSFCEIDTETYFLKEQPMEPHFASSNEIDKATTNQIQMGKESVSINPQSDRNIEAKLWNSKGNLHYKNNEFNEAINSYNTAIQLDHAFGQPYNNLALVYLKLSRLPESIVLLQKSVLLPGTNQEKSDAWNRLGTIYRRINDVAKAEYAYQKADELNSQNPADQVGGIEFEPKDSPAGDSVSWTRLGEQFFDLGNYKEAEYALVQAVKTQPESYQTLSKLGMAFVFQGKYEEAISIYQKAIELTSGNTEKSALFNRLGNVYRRMNNQAKALEAYQKAVVLTGTKSKLLTRTRFSLLGNCYSN